MFERVIPEIQYLHVEESVNWKDQKLIIFQKLIKTITIIFDCSCSTMQLELKEKKSLTLKHVFYRFPLSYILHLSIFFENVGRSGRFLKTNYTYPVNHNIV